MYVSFKQTIRHVIPFTILINFKRIRINRYYRLKSNYAIILICIQFYCYFIVLIYFACFKAETNSITCFGKN